MVTLYQRAPAKEKILLKLSEAYKDLMILRD